MAQPDPAIIAKAFTDLGAQIPLISNHPKTLDQFQNFQEEVREQFRRHDEYQEEVRAQFRRHDEHQEEVRQQSRRHDEHQQEVQGQFRRHDEHFTQLERTLATLERGLDDMRREFGLRLDQMSRDQALLPLRLYNTSCGNKAHLRYPAGVQAQAITRDNLLSFTVLECQQLAVALGLPALLPNVTIIDRRQQIASYLGVSI